MPEDELRLFPEYSDDFPALYLPATSSPIYAKRVEIENFKAIRHTVVELPAFAVLTGVNNSGKSTILQGISVAFECLRLCVDRDSWQIPATGRLVSVFEFLPANEPRDLWYQRTTRSGQQHVPIRIRVDLTNGFAFTAEINYRFGGLNVRIEDWTAEAGEDAVKDALALAPILIPGHVEIGAHEEMRVPAQVHRLVQSGLLSSVMRNVLVAIGEDASVPDSGTPGYSFLKEAIKRYFGIDLRDISFNPERDLEIRAPYLEGDTELDVVSAGSGMHQILKLLAFTVWRKARIVLLDEPDAHLHTALQTRLVHFLQELGNRMGMQIILATHSRDVIGSAALQSVLPVDASAPVVRPLMAFEHLLSEYRRLGGISNVDLALLYQTRRCLFVEGDSDSDALPRIAEKLGLDLFSGRNQYVVFRFRGRDKFTMVKDLADLLAEVTGLELKWFVLRDRDSATPRALEHLRMQAEEKGISNYHIWESYCWENYLTASGILQLAIEKKALDRGVAAPPLEWIERTLERVASDVLTEVRPVFLAEAQSYYVRNEIGENPRDEALRDSLEYLDTCGNPASALQVLPGPKLFGQFVSVLQEEHGLTLSLNEVIGALDENSVPAEIREFFARLASNLDPRSP